MNIKHNRKGVKADFRDNTIDKDAVRELILFIENNYDLYKSYYEPAFKNLVKKYQKGVYDHDLAVKMWQYVADEGVRRYNKEFGSGTYSVAWLNPATRRAIAEELRDSNEDEIMYEEPVNASTRRRSIKASSDYRYIEEEVANNSNSKLVENAYQHGDLGIIMTPEGVYWFETCKSNKVADIAKRVIKKLYPDAKYLFDVKASMSRRPIKAARGRRVDGYAVEIRDMHDAMHDLLLFNNKDDAEWAYEQLNTIEHNFNTDYYYDDLDEYEYRDMISDIFNQADDYIEEIDFRREIDDNNVWTAYDDSTWQIVNDVQVDLWL